MRIAPKQLLIVAMLAGFSGVAVAVIAASRARQPPPDILAGAPLPPPALAADPAPVVAAIPEVARGTVTIRLLDHAIPP